MAASARTSRVAKLASVRLLEQRGIAHELIAFDPAIRSAVGVAEAAGVVPETVYKTLVVEHDPPRAHPLLVMVPANSELDLRALAAALGEKKLRMASQAAAERLTGLQVGGISALALTARRFPTCIDDRALALDSIMVSAGARGFDIRLAGADLLAVTGAQPVRLAPEHRGR